MTAASPEGIGLKGLSAAAPVALFVYNRPEHTEKTVRFLESNHLAPQTPLYIFSDGPRKFRKQEKTEHDQERVRTVRDIVSRTRNFLRVEVVQRAENFGLDPSVIAGVSEVVRKHGKVIVVEDDLVTHPGFLDFMNTALDVHARDTRVFSITGFNYPRDLLELPGDYHFDTYLAPRAHSWTWATWADRWEKFDPNVPGYDSFVSDPKAVQAFNRGGDDMSGMLALQMEGKDNAWDIRWCYTLYQNGAYCLYPRRSFVNNIGNDGTGKHHDSSGRFAHLWTEGDELRTAVDTGIQPDDEVIRRFHAVFSAPTPAPLGAAAARKQPVLKSIAGRAKRKIARLMRGGEDD